MVFLLEQRVKPMSQAPGLTDLWNVSKILVFLETVRWRRISNIPFFERKLYTNNAYIVMLILNSLPVLLINY